MFQQNRVNLFLLVMNIIALGNFSYPPNNQYLVIFMLMTICKIPLPIKTKMKIVTVLSLLASFVNQNTFSQLVCILALGFSVNTAYQLDLTEGPSAINTALGLSHILSYWSRQYLQKNSIDRDITLLIFTLPNLFLSYDCQSTINKRLFIINPYIDDRWQYSVGFILSIYTTSLTSIEKHHKLFSIALILLIQKLFQSMNYQIGILSFLRGLIVYTQKIHESQKYFILGFLLFKIYFNQFLIEYMFIGYLVIAVILYQEHQQKVKLHRQRKNEGVGTSTELQNIQMQQLKYK